MIERPDSTSWASRLATAAVRSRRALLGDRVGATVFLGALVYFGAIWQVSAFTPGSNAVANTLLAVADGHLHVDRLVYTTESGTVPGIRVAGNRRFGSGYGQPVLSLPVLWLLTAASPVVDPSIVLATAWSLALAAFAGTLGALLGRGPSLARGGIAVAAVLWAGNVAFARPAPGTVSLLALGATSMVAAGLVAVVVYRLVQRVHGRRAGAVAGAAVVLASPVGFWATVPDRHSLVALGVAATVYAFHRSRAAPESRAVRWRALTYAVTGLTAWIHALDGAVLLAALATVDLATGRSRQLRAHLAAAVALGVSLVPFVVTTALAAGVPLDPIRAFAAWWGVGALLDPGRAFAVVVRSEFTGTPVVYSTVGPVNLKLRGAPVALSVLEAMPLAGALFAGLLAVLRRRDRPSLAASARSASATDLLVVTYLGLLVLVYLPALPMASSVTVRSLHPLYPLGVYLLVRVEFVRDALATGPFLARTYAGFVVVGCVAFVLLGGQVTGGPHALARLNGLLAFLAAAVLAYLGGVASLLEGDHARSTAVGLAFAAATTTVFVLLSSFVYFPGNRHALTVSRLVAERLVLW